MVFSYLPKHVFPDERYPLRVRIGRQRPDVPLHQHEFMELVLVTQGRALHPWQHQSIPFPEDDETVGNFSIAAGDVFVIAPGQIHTYRDLRGLEIYNVFFMLELFSEAEREGLVRVPGFRSFFLGEAELGQPMPEPNLRLELTVWKALQKTLDMILLETEQRQPGYQLASRSLLLQSIVELCRHFSAQQQPEASRQRQESGHAQSVQRALDYMEAHYAEQLTLTRIADESFLSPHHFSRVFKQVTGIPPWDYLTQLRIEQAKRRLKRTNDTITTIALDVGFCDGSYFAKVFRKREGCSPSVFRQQQHNRFYTP